MPTRHPLNSTGFTIMELLVSVTIASMLMWFINVLFNDTQKAVRIGIATGNAVVASESIGNQLATDAKLMKAPDATVSSEGGFLIIINKQYTNVIMPDPTSGSNDEIIIPTLRSDQLIFIADASGGANDFRSMTPKNANQFQNDITADHARIWYGHVTPTNSDGTDPLASVITPADATRAHQWVLGRQAMLINPTGLAGTDTYFDTLVVNSGGAGTSLDRALTDVTDWNYLTTVIPVLGGTFPNVYLDYTFAASRLRTNVAPDIGNFDSWRIAQTHPLLSRNVSDFIVEFAADIHTGTSIDETPDGLVDTHPGFSASTVPSAPDTDRNGRPYATIPADGIRWYSSIANYPGAASYDSTQPLTFIPPSTGYVPYIDSATIPAAYSTDLGATADAAFVFEFDDDEKWNGTNSTTVSKWPYLIRIRYRLHDTAGQMRSVQGGNVVIGEERMGGGAPTSGRWFEHIIKVNRP